MKQIKHKHCTSIWHRMPRGIRAGNSPVWQGDDQVGWKKGEGEKKASKNISKITKKWKKEKEYNKEFYGINYG